ncbi:MAG: Rne/Rng family ribonuclease [Candidatus Binatia bacterium]|nr:Rne/Rng family ribonuclease [Candidatus Binatia bacterium]MDG2011072.1 Rne/Rng family ribonuclease [Candidatus Binatia bacterium]
MRKQILISRSSVDTRIGLTEDGTLAEIQVENPAENSSAGNAYKGKVVRVLPGMQAAFVDIGLEKAAFMHVSDFWDGPDEPEEADDLADDLEEDTEDDLADDLEEDTEPSEPVDPDEADSQEADSAEPHASDSALDEPDQSAESTGIGPLEDKDAGPEPAGDAALLATEQDAADPAAPQTDEESAWVGDEDPAEESAEVLEVLEEPAHEGETAHEEADPSGDPAAEQEESADATGAAGKSRKPGPRGRSRRKPSTPPPSIDELLKPGQEILVQVSKEPMGTKGARVTGHISLPGRYIVYMPTSNHIGVSRRIEKARERQRLKKIVAENRPGGKGGYIVRTACEGLSKKEILADIKFLSKLWQGIEKKAASEGAPSLLHEDLDIVLRSMRDLLTNEVEEILVDDPGDHERILEFIDTALQPELKSRVRRHESLAPLFDEVGVENQVRRALDRRVWLKSGGYLIVDQTEALTTIDVNTGRFVGKKTHEETVLKTNMEAAKACVDQMRLRNIGGIIVIDLIDMELAENRKKVSEAIEEAVKRDKARTNILKISELGLVEMTRKRTRENLQKIITIPCPSCDGLGRQKSPEAVAGDALREALRKAEAADNPRNLTIRIASDIAGILRQAIEKRPNAILAAKGIQLSVKGEPNFERNAFEIEFGGQAKRKRSGGRRRRRRSGAAKAAAAPSETAAD